ncbi:hypothetical protein Bca52824_007894 [Brassica carinata]|uniref:PLAC8 family protein n=1 Tax=Brassica carinata TaxID=52824 RepID=A0A8X7W8S3_BRACI|nr:hypothetical protein Bca52824_007894 [Brassica carinata]
MGRSQDKLEKMQLRQSYRNVWQSDLMSTVTADTPYCCFSCFCGPCVSYLLRKRALYNDMSRYTCCGGYMPCSGRCGESKCPQLCLATEVFLCFGNSVASTRFMLQDEFNIHTTQCDNCIIGFMFCLNQIACIFSLVACIVGSDELSEASQLLSCLADMVYCTYTQHKIEMDKRDGVLGSQPMSVPPAQQMSRIDQPTPPYAGYPPATGYPQPYYPQPGHGYPPAPGYHPPGHGYPPAPGYPPPSHGYPPAPAYPPAGHGYPPAPEYPSK